MKKLFYAFTAVICISFFCGCWGNDPKPAGNDTVKNSGAKDTGTKKATTTAEKIDTIKYKHLAFLDDATLKKIQEKASIYSEFLAKFKPVPLGDFTKYNGNFNTKLINSSVIQNFQPPTFSIYDMYNDFQMYLGLQGQQYTDLSSGIKYKTKVRIYPAIDPSKQFYLVFVAEKQDYSSTTPSDAISDISVLYSIRGNTFDMIPKGNPMIQAKTDVIAFQSMWKGLGANYYECKSFSYTIIDYDELLSSTPPFWDENSEKTNSSSNIYVRVFPAIDDSDPTKLVFRLVFKLYRKSLFGSYNEISSKGLFDNMDPCPTACPDPTTEIK